MDHGALGQTLNFLCLIFLIHKMGTRSTSQICWEVESTLQSAVEAMSQQHYPRLTTQATAQGSHCGKRSPDGAAELSFQQAISAPSADVQGFRQNHSAVY